MRFTDLRDTVIAGADISGADLTESWLTDARFDERTRFEDTTLDEELVRFVTGHAAPRGSEVHGFQLAHLDPTTKLVRERNHDGRLDAVLARLAALRQTVAKDPDYDWASAVITDLPDLIVDEILEVAGEVDICEDI